MSSEHDDREWIINKFKSIVNPFLRKTADAHEIMMFWMANDIDLPRPVKMIAKTVNVVKEDTTPDNLGNVMNNLMYDFITTSSVKVMDMDDATALLRNNVNTNKGVIGLFGTGLGMRAWYITCGNWILCNADITPPKAKIRVSTKPLKWTDVFKGGGSEGDIKLYYFTDGAAVLAPPKLRKVSLSAATRGTRGSTTYIEQSHILPDLLLYTTIPVLNWKYLPTQFL